MPRILPWTAQIETFHPVGYTILNRLVEFDPDRVLEQLTSARTNAYRYCEKRTRREAKNFYFGFISLPRFRRRSICAVYALSRRWDDIADGDIPEGRKKQLLDEEEKKLNSLNDPFDDPVYAAVRDTIRRFRIPRRYFHDLLDGVRMDLTKKRYRTFDELIDYCYHVASSPGLIVLEIFGYESDEARYYARRLGYAMQLTNILRDVRKDLERDRIYLPLRELEMEGITEEDLSNLCPSPALTRVLRRLGKRAKQFFREATQLFPLLTPSSRTCPLILMQLYRTLLNKIERRDFDVFSSPVNLNFLEKCTVLFDSVLFHPAAT